MIDTLFRPFGTLLLLIASGIAHGAIDSEERWTGDLDALADRGHIRALVVYSKTYYFLDGPRVRGLSHDALELFEKHLNKKLKRPKARPVDIVYIPVPRGEILQALEQGVGDIAVANLTITDERRKKVDFGEPWLKKVREVLVTHKDRPALQNLDELAGKEVYVRASSSYHESLLALNKRLIGKQLSPVKIKVVDEHLEDADLMEMVAVGLLPAVVVDDHKATFWADIFPDLRLHEAAPLREKGQVAWAIRKNSPKLKAMVDSFAEQNRQGSLTGNMLLKRYLKANLWVRNNLAQKERERFKDTVALFKKYAGEYGFDWLMVAAQAYQESGIDQTQRSPAGAIGVMQLLPSTAADPNVGIPHIDGLEPNIHAGVKYLRFLLDRYFSDAPMTEQDKHFFAIASYNAGPARIRALRTKAEAQGLDPNRWFNNVETVAARQIGRETVQYVANIYKYYLAYKLTLERMDERSQARKLLSDPGPGI